MRGRATPWWLATAYIAAIVPADYIIATGMLRGLRRRAEGSTPGRNLARAHHQRRTGRVVPMDGIHDLGGMQGFGAVGHSPAEPPFHGRWEATARALMEVVAGAVEASGGEFRHTIERMDPAWYLQSPYYEHWATATATGLVEGGLITQDELDERLGAPYPVARPVRAPQLDEPGPSVDTHRYAVGDAVHVRAWHPVGHTRAPRYVQGKCGVVVRLDGVFSLPDVEYHCDQVRMEPTYSVRFEALELWGTPGDPVHVDLWESYLEPRQASLHE